MGKKNHRARNEDYAVSAGRRRAGWEEHEEERARKARKVSWELALVCCWRPGIPFQLPRCTWAVGGRNQAEVSVHQLTLVSVVRPPCLVVLAWPAIGTSRSVNSPRQARRSRRKTGVACSTLISLCPTAQLQLEQPGCECVIHSFLLASLPVWADSTPTQRFAVEPRGHRHLAAPFTVPRCVESLPVSDVGNWSWHATIDILCSVSNYMCYSAVLVL